MLRQPRPKSQPPIKFTSPPLGSHLIGSHSKQTLGALALGKLMQPQVPQMSPRGCLGSNQNQANMEQLQKHHLDLTSSSSSDSSASSLASSTLSLSTDSSTSTVLAALSSIKQQQQKKLTKTQENASSAMSIQQQSTRRQQSSEEEEETDQALSSAASSTSSSSTSSSSSSGLSSMNSLSQHTGPQSEDSSQLNSIEEEEQQQQHQQEEEEEVVRSEHVRQCLNDLVAEVSQQVEVESGAKLPAKYEGLHGAMLATTSQHTTSGSSDEELADNFAYSSRKDFAEAHLVRSFNVNDLLSDSLLLHLARQCVVSQTSPGLRWLVRLKASELLLEWAPRGTNKLEALPLGRIVKHLVDGPLIVWLVQGAAGVELETTLDDIALALDEPVEQPERPSMGLEALVWLCCDERVALRISDAFNSLKHSNELEASLLYHNNSGGCIEEAQDNYIQTTGQNPVSTTGLLDSSVAAKQRSQATESSPTTSSKVNRLSSGRLKTDSNGSLVEQLDTAAIKEKVSHKKTTDMAAFGRASYYKSVASRVLSNGQHKIRSLRDEVIKFNRHSSNLSLNTSSLTATASGSGKRSSRLMNGGTGKEVDHPRGATDFHQRQKLSSCSNLAHWVGDSETMNQGRHSSLYSNKNNLNSNSNNNSSSATSCNQIPAVKPRTSILKRGDTTQVSASDNVKSITGSSLLRRQNTLISTAGSPGAFQASPSQLTRRHLAAPAANQAPRSILKNSKSVSNLAIITSGGGDSNNKSDLEKQPLSTKRVHQRLQVVAAGTTIDSRSPPHQAAELKKKASVNRIEDKRRSTYSLANESAIQFFDHEYNDADEREHVDEFNIDSSEQREQTFERIRRRASCYDVTKLMSKSNSIESQLTKLRSGSTSSISGKSRQRRPALLLGESEQEAREYLQSTSIEHAPKQTTGVKGRAYAGSSDGPNSIQGGRRQLKLRQQEALVQSGKVQEDFLAAESSSKLEKKSEFDPRSLRRIKLPSGCDTAASRDAKQLSEIQAFKCQKLATESSITKPQAREHLKATKKVVIQQVIDEPEPTNVNHKLTNEENTDDTSEEVQVDEEECQPVSTSSLSKKGPFSLLRQSFNQKTISSMLKFSSRASMRWRPATEVASSTGAEVDKVKRVSAADEMNQQASNKSEQTASAIAQAEANLIAARQLKQQAQKLKEQEKRELQMQQQQAAEHRSLMLAAVQYNQQMQQQQQQQQQLVYQQAQQYARAQMFDSTGLRFQHQQMMYQRQHQQQHQVAFLSSAQQYMVAQQQLAIMQQHQPMLCPPGLAMAGPGVDLFRSTGAMRAGPHKLPPGMLPMAGVQQQQQPQPHQLLPMSVNHHSSFNIVYAAGGPNSHQQLPVAQGQKEPVFAGVGAVEEPVVVRSKQSRLGQSMRKTVRSILSSKTQASRIASKAATQLVESSGGKEMKSALKSVALSRDLNSEGSDADTGSSSDSATNSHKPSSAVTVPKSALKKSSNLTNHIEKLPASSYNNTCTTLQASATGQQQQQQQQYRATGVKYRQSIHLNYDEDMRQAEGSSFSGSGSDSNGSNGISKTGAGKSRRKNVTFSTKLTSIQ